MPTIQSASERDRAACSSRANSLGRAQRVERRLDRGARHRRQPQPLDGLLRARLLVRPGEDQLALAAGVAGVDDDVDVGALEQLGDHRELLAGALVAHHEPELVRHDRQVGHPPLLVLRVVLVGLGQLDEMPDGPRHDVGRRLQIALALGERARQDPGQVAAHGRLLGDDERLPHTVPEGSGWLIRRKDRSTPSRARPRASRARSRSARRSRRAGRWWWRRRSSRRPVPAPSTIGPPELPGPHGAAQRDDRAPHRAAAVGVLGHDLARLPEPPRAHVVRPVEREPEDRRRRAGARVARDVERRRVEAGDAQDGDVVARVEGDRLRVEARIGAARQHARVVLPGHHVRVGHDDAVGGDPARALDADAARGAEDLHHAAPRLRRPAGRARSRRAARARSPAGRRSAGTGRARAAC